MNSDKDFWRYVDPEDLVQTANWVNRWQDLLRLESFNFPLDNLEKVLAEHWQAGDIENRMAHLKRTESDVSQLAAITGDFLIICSENPVVIDLREVHIKFERLGRKKLSVELLSSNKSFSLRFFLLIEENVEFIQRMKVISRN